MERSKLAWFHFTEGEASFEMRKGMNSVITEFIPFYLIIQGGSWEAVHRRCIDQTPILRRLKLYN